MLFIDAMHSTQASNESKLWLDKTGHDKAIETTGSRTRLTLSGLLI
jgi:hypothetical protein